MKLRTRGLALLLALAVMLGLASMTTTASAAPKTGSITEEVSGTVNGVAETGTLTVTEFTKSGGVLNAVGTLELEMMSPRRSPSRSTSSTAPALAPS